MTNPTFTLKPLTPHDVAYTDGKARLLKQFNTWVADGEHAMTIILDQGLYRHLRFRKTSTTEYWFDIITYPGSLVFTGDMGTMVFSRNDDMLEFFHGDYVNVGYWLEKEQTRGSENFKEHDADAFKAWAMQDFWERSRDMPAAAATAWWQSLVDNLLGRNAYWSTEYREAVEQGLTEINDQHPMYEDIWDNSWSRWRHQAELGLCAILAGTRTWHAAKSCVCVSVDTVMGDQVVRTDLQAPTPCPLHPDTPVVPPRRS